MHNATAADNHILKAKQKRKYKCTTLLQQTIVKVKCEIECYTRSEAKEKQLFEMTTKICLFKKLLFTMENATTAGSNQSNISRIYI